MTAFATQTQGDGSWMLGQIGHAGALWSAPFLL